MAKLSNVKYPNEVVEIGSVQYRKVERKAQAGDIVRITDEDVPSYVVEGAFYEAIRIDNIYDTIGILDEDGDRYWLDKGDYEVYEKVTEPERLKVGEYAKIIGTFWPVNSGTIGDIVEILDIGGDRPSSYGIKFVKDGVEKRSLAKHLVRATESEVEAAKKAAEREKKIGEFADGGYAVVVDERKGALAGFDSGDYVKVFEHDGGFALRVKHTKGTNGYCNADALRKVSREEYEEATMPKPMFTVGEKVRLISGGGRMCLHGFEDGDICEVIRNHHTASTDVRIEREDGCVGYAEPEQLEKVSAEEAKWAAIGRNVNEFKRGDIVEAKQYSGRGEQVYGEVEDVSKEGELLGLRLPNGRYNAVYVEGAKLLVPVEQRFDRAKSPQAEGGASTSK